MKNTKVSFQESEGSVLISSLMTQEKKQIHTIQGTERDHPLLSVVVPVHNEDKNIGPLAIEISDVLSPIIPYEIIYVDDGSTDDTYQVLLDLTDTVNHLKILQHDTRKGQSAAIYSGVTIANAPLVLTIDGDGQNDPADIPVLLEMYNSHSGEDGHLMITGWRKGRKDSWTKRISSRIANTIRSHFLSDSTPDTGCGLKIFRQEDFLRFPAFDHMHRFLPALMIRSGGRVISTQVNHRPRRHGSSHYGVVNRLFVGVMDIVGVSWLNRRKIKFDNTQTFKSLDKPGPD